MKYNDLIKLNPETKNFDITPETAADLEKAHARMVALGCEKNVSCIHFLQMCNETPSLWDALFSKEIELYEKRVDGTMVYPRVWRRENELLAQGLKPCDDNLRNVLSYLDAWDNETTLGAKITA